MAGNRLINYRELRQQVQRLGSTQTTKLLTEALKKRQVRPDDFSIRDLAEAYLSPEWVDNLHPRRGRYTSPRSLLEADSSAVQYADFSNITGQIYFTEIKQAYESEEFAFSKIVPTKTTDILTMERIPGVSRVGDEFSVIGEGQEYPNFGFSEDYQERPALAKRGGKILLTKESIFGDKTGLLLQRAKEIGDFLGLNRELRIIDAFIDENAGAKSAPLGGHRYHWKGTSYATYQSTAPWSNVTTANALTDFTSVNTAWLKLVQMLDPYTGQPIRIQAKHLIVTPQNVMTAQRILNATNVQTHVGGYATTGNLQDMHAPSPVAAVVGSLQLVSSQQLAARAATDTDWWLGDLSKTVAYSQAWDITTEEAPSNSKDSFDRDVVFQVKASELGAAWVYDPRYMTENQA